jgi:flagellar hook assembly protein FlgD
MDNYPNPFNPNTKIEYTIVKQTNVTLTISDILGREVSVLVNGKKNAGRYSVAWDATGVSSGIYIYTLQTDSERLSKRMMLVK